MPTCPISETKVECAEVRRATRNPTHSDPVHPQLYTHTPPNDTP